MATTNSTPLPTFNYGKQTEYQKLLEGATNYQPFTYNPADDPSYAAYRKQYLREADRAQQSSMAQAATMSGGRPSTYAITAGQQAGNYYRGQLNDAIPALQQNAYQRHLSDFEARQSAYNAMSADREFDYNKYMQDWNNAWTLYSSGVRTPEILALLGIPEETTAPAEPKKTTTNNNNNNTVEKPSERDKFVNNAAKKGIYPLFY